MNLEEIIAAMSLEEAQARLLEIEELLGKEPESNEEIEELTKEVDLLLAHIEELTKEDGEDEEVEEPEVTPAEQAQEQRSALLEAVKAGAGTVVRTFKEEERMDKVFTLASPEYRSAVFNHLAGIELNKEERAAYDAVVATTGAIALPTTVADEVHSNLRSKSHLLGDIDVSNIPTILSYTVVDGVKQGDAKQVAEGKANDDGDYETRVVELKGKEFSANIEVSYKTSTMTGEQLDRHFIKELTKRLEKVIAKSVVDNITATVHEDNKLGVKTAGVLGYDDLVGALGAVDTSEGIVIYANNKDYFNHIIGMVNKNGTPIFNSLVVDSNGLPQGSIVGVAVKVETDVPEGKLYIGAPQDIKANYVTDIFVESDKDIKKRVNIHAAHCDFEAALVNTKGFVILDTAVTAVAAAKAAKAAEAAK